MLILFKCATIFPGKKLYFKKANIKNNKNAAKRKRKENFPKEI